MNAITVAMQAARQAGELARRQFRQPQEIARKGPADPVTQADRDAEAIVVSMVRQAFPDHGFLGEEGNRSQVSAEYVWVVDPIDGTRNYSHGIPFFCTSVALTRKHQTIVGVIYDPMRDEMFHAELGKGAYLNGERIHVSRTSVLSEALLSLSLVPVQYVDNAHLALPMLVRLQPLVESVRVMGSAALHLAYVACGRLDITYQDSLHSWDMLAGALLVQEAGGIITDFAGHSQLLTARDCIAANCPTFHSAVLQVAREVMGERKD